MGELPLRIFRIARCLEYLYRLWIRLASEGLYVRRRRFGLEEGLGGGRWFWWRDLVVVRLKRFPSSVAAVANSAQAWVNVSKVVVETRRSRHWRTKGGVESSSSGFGWWGMSSSG